MSWQRIRAAAACGATLLTLITLPWSDQAPAQAAGAAGREPATVKLSATQQKQIGLQTAVLAAESHPEQFRAYGAVLDVARLTELTNNYANAQAQLQTAQAKLDVAKLAFERARDLFQSAAMPKKDAEAAEGTFRTDQAALAAAESQVKTLMATARQEWGPVIGKGIIERSPQVVQLIERELLLVQVTLPPGVTLAAPPRTALAQAPTRTANIDLQYLSPAPRTDPRIQGVSYFFVGAGDSGLLPGMNTTAYVPSGRSFDGVFVEDTAIVQWQGRSWVYLRAGPETFRRHPIRTDQPVSDDDYVVQDIPSGSEIVLRGAQVLLSEEARSELRGNGGDDD
ncbi:efflux RND transporter periplasmic adaptor subunit [Bradyrhizobium ontarionense]|uniref:Efflux RND transporter periplasmic adaptor subunit n=1 Tax=Bradyrhizobium ontarionense TaxID=2898149 RepID=A0ABY3R7N4_9BRAD|nr:efflux RND transporter periplasmic adaptor subunit [Bradyrhizobium sp. A19]UFZ03339.1 efflux RND transporter periplasmic adaptor subunit [Bradyrhizobium sp. A19]